jgi:hypothetical protein
MMTLAIAVPPRARKSAIRETTLAKLRRLRMLFMTPPGSTGRG